MTLFSLPPAERYATAAGLDYVPIGVAGFETDIAPSRVKTGRPPTPSAR